MDPDCAMFTEKKRKKRGYYPAFKREKIHILPETKWITSPFFSQTTSFWCVKM